MVDRKSFKTCIDKDMVCLLGTNRDFLEEKGKIISQYSQLAYPSTTVEEFTVSPCKSEIMLEQGFSYYINLNPILPPLIKVILELSHCIRFPGMNCHGAAVVVAGIYPAVTCPNFPEWDNRPGMHEISFQNLSLGDLIYIKRHINGESDYHSFVFLDHDIYLSANGRNQPLRFHPANDVLNAYQLPQNALKTNCKDMRIFRKNKEWNFSESVTSALADYYSVITTMAWDMPLFSGYVPLKEIGKYLYQQLCMSTNDNEAVLKAVYKRISDRFPLSMARAIESEAVAPKAQGLTTNIIAAKLGITLTAESSSQEKKADLVSAVVTTQNRDHRHTPSNELSQGHAISLTR